MNARAKLQSMLKCDEYIFDSREMTTSSILEMTANGLNPVCCKCGTRLEFALTPSEAKRKHIAPGVRCPRNINHCQIVVSFADSQ